MMTTATSRLRLGVLLAFLIPSGALAQATPAETRPPLTDSSTLNPDAEQTAKILGLAAPLAKLRAMQSQAPCSSLMSPEQISTRQELSDRIQESALDVDAVLGEIEHERTALSELRATLQNRRDHTVGLLKSAALITGSGLGAAASATQFTFQSSTTQNVGNGFIVGAGVASMILSLIAIQKQNGPQASVGDVPNMLAPLFDRAPGLRTYYPPSVLKFLDSAPASQHPYRGTRLEQLKAQWVEAGRIDASGPAKQSRTIAAASTSMDPSLKISINDLTNRIEMLDDVSGRVSLMKRDLAALMHFYAGGGQRCLAGNPSDN